MDQVMDAMAVNAGNFVLGSINASDSIEESVSAASVEKARAYRESRMIRKLSNGKYVQAPICSTRIKELGEYGIGLELYFLMLKQLGLAFLIIGLISVWPMAENYYGQGFSEGQKKQPWDVLTLGNQHSYDPSLSVEDAEYDLTTFGNSKIRLIIADLIYTLIFIFFIVYFQISSGEKIQANARKNAACDDYAVEFTGLPHEAIPVSEVIEFFGNVGDVVEVYLARKFDGVLNSYRARAELVMELRYYIRLASNGVNTTKKQLKLQKKITEFDKKIDMKERSSSRSHDELPVIKGFVIFSTLSAKTKCLKDFSKANGCCRKYPLSLRFRRRYKLKVKSTSEPSNINWENIEYSPCKRFLRQVLAIIIACVVLLASVIIIYLMRSIDDGLPSKTQCVVDYGVSASQSLGEAKLLYTSDTAKYCYCGVISITSILNDSDLRSFCTYYIEKRSYSIAIRFLVSAGVVMLNFILKIIFRLLGKFEKYVSRSKEQVQVMQKVFLAMFTNTALVVLAVNANFSSLWFIVYLPFNQYIFNSQFSDFTRDWYVQVGSTITITMLISVFSPHVLNFLVFYPRGGCKRCCVKKYKTQREINSAFQGPEFDIATRYSQVLNVVFSSFLYSGGIPLLNATCCCTMFVLYWTDKFLILRHYSKPPRYSEELNSAFLAILPYAAVMHSGFSLYMLGSDSIFPESFYSVGGYLYANSNSISDRVIGICGFIFIGLIVVALGVYLYVKSVSWLCMPIREKNTAVLPESKTFPQRRFFDEIENIKEHGLHTFDIRSNPVYSELIANLDSAAEAVKGFQKVNRQRTVHDSKDFLMDNSN